MSEADVSGADVSGADVSGADVSGADVSGAEVSDARASKRVGRLRGPHAEFAAALVLDLIGAVGALLVALATWQVITTPRARPLGDDVLAVSGRTLDASSTALALVALAGVVAVLATRRVWRRVVGVLVALAGAGLVWRAIASGGAVSTSRARSLVASHHRTIAAQGGATPSVVVHAVWPVLSVCCGVLVLVAGLLVAWRGPGWQAMSTRYEPPADRAADPARAATTLWTALDRGEDPTDG